MNKKKNYNYKKKNKKKSYKKNFNKANIKNSIKKFDINTIPSKRFKAVIVFIVLIFLLLLIRLFYLQFITGSSLKERAYNQQTSNDIISAKRGTIYDSTGKVLAISSQADTISINPKKIVGPTDEATKEKKEKVAKGLSEIFELDYNEVLDKLNSKNNVETIAKKVDTEKVAKLKSWMQENKISVGINIDEDSKRTYPYSNLASHVIGFCGNDNNGLQGIELKWNNVLAGTNGKVVTSQDAIQEQIPDANETYIPEENGSNLVLTIDVNIQSIVEKYLKQAVIDNSCKNGGTALAMNPKTGDILAMASYPDYDLNTPFTPTSTDLLSKWDSLNSTDKSSQLNEMWRNRNISSAYEPGSTFKLITSSVALEENITSEDVAGNFVCLGYEDVNGVKIKCWRKNPHGSQTLRQALENSCNPAFMQLGKKIGAQTLYKYYSAFGLFEKTGIALPSESTGIFHKLNNVRSVELATMSFGQRITVTPLQLVSAISAIANNGKLMQPRIVKQIINTDSNSTTNIETKEVRKVVSKETSERMLDLMKSVVTDGTGHYAQVAGYSVGGKTGTSEPISGNEDAGYVASYVAVSPTENPEICLLVALYDPQGKSHQGGQVCGPVVSQMLTEILPYIGLTSTDISNATVNVSESNNNTSVTVPDIRNKTLTETKKILNQAGLKYNYSVNGDENSLLVTDQTPNAGTTLSKNSIVCLYTEENETRVSVTVPNLVGMTLEQAKENLKQKKLNITSEGSGTVIKSQEIKKDSSVEEGTVIKVTLGT